MNQHPDRPTIDADGALVMPLEELGHLFNAPAVDPTSMGLPEVLGMSGVEYLLQQLELVNGGRTRLLRLLLPRARITPGINDQTQAAIRRYAEHRIQQQLVAVRKTRRHGARLTVVALVLLAIFIGLSSIFASELTEGMRPLLRRTFEYGFEIVGWVMLWHPIEVLILEPIGLKTRIRVLRRLMGLRVVVNEFDVHAAGS